MEQVSAVTSGEFAYIDWLRARTPTFPHVLIGPGDDTAAFQVNGARPALITTDMLLEGSCFLMEAGGRRIGRKAMSVNLSDIAAMAGIPTVAVVSVGLPRKGGRALAEELYLGLREVADSFGVALVGGDTNTWEGPLTISVTLLGEATDKGPVARSGAKVGDWIFVTGALGGSILGKHLDFTPRVHEALLLHQAVDLHAMIDLSDGCSADLHHICEESHCGAVLFSEAIPITAEVKQQSQSDGRTPLEHALQDGEDFELVFCVDPKDGERLLSQSPLTHLAITRIGTILESGYFLETAGVRSPLTPKGYSHEMR